MAVSKPGLRASWAIAIIPVIQTGGCFASDGVRRARVERAQARRGRRFRIAACLLLAAGLPLAAPSAQAAPSAHAAPVKVAVNPLGNALDQGYRDLYNLDFAGAHVQFAAWMQAHPADPLGAASDAAAYLFGEFDRLSIIDVELFADQSRFDHRGKRTSDPTVRKAFEDRSDQANRLADAALARNPKDANALAALSFSKQASALARQALAIDPAMYDAYLASGVENYMLSLKFAPLRWVLSLTGAGTDRAEGIRLLRVTASQGHYLAPFARMMLAVVAIRDGHPQQARDTLTSLAKEFPGNSLYIRQRDRIR